MVADTTRVFPDVGGRNLEGREFQLPGDLEGELNLLMIAFQRQHQSLVDSWMPAAAAWAASHPRLHYYELPTISSGYRLFRGFIDGGMRGGIADVEARERTITLYLDKDAFRSALGLADEETIYVLLVDPGGTVFELVEGPYSEEKALSLERGIEALLPESSPGSSVESDVQ
ncbi:MAG: hypothetical protein GF405_03125 [Candidatus Eisenbacteria bacterium]|nr:hypothetical protein [Candidatus Eisenbacteria bacterium]